MWEGSSLSKFEFLFDVVDYLDDGGVWVCGGSSSSKLVFSFDENKKWMIVEGQT